MPLGQLLREWNTSESSLLIIMPRLVCLYLCSVQKGIGVTWGGVEGGKGANDCLIFFLPKNRFFGGAGY